MNEQEILLMWQKVTSRPMTTREVEFAKMVAAHEREECAKVCDEKAKRNFPWGSENSDKYHAQADWAEVCAKTIRARKA